jgi:hypothetical protein
MGGCGLTLDRRLPVGTPVEFRGDISGLGLPSHGKVVWAEQTRAGVFHGIVVTGSASEEEPCSTGCMSSGWRAATRGARRDRFCEPTARLNAQPAPAIRPATASRRRRDAAPWESWHWTGKR